MALAEHETVTVDDLPVDLREYSVILYGKWPTLEEQERDYLEKVLVSTDYNLGESSRILDLPRTTLWRKMKRYGLSKPA